MIKAARRVTLGALVSILILPAQAFALDPDPSEPPPSITAWQPGGISGPFTEAAIEAAAVAGAEWLVVHRGTIPLLSVKRAGRTIQEAPEGFRYPMSALALDPRKAVPLIGRSAAAALSAGQVLMGSTSAGLRGASVGDMVEFIGWDGSINTLRIAQIVPDERVEFAELVFSTATAERFGFVRPSSVLIWDVDDDDKLVIDLWRRLPTGRTRITASTDPARPDDVLPTVLIKEQFGEFAYRTIGRGDAIRLDSEWRPDNVVDVDLPLLGPFRCNRIIAPLISEAIDQIIEAGLTGEISRNDFQISGGCYNARAIRGGDKGGAISRHTWGVAIDINPTANPYGGAIEMRPEIVEIFRNLGFAWGGGWTFPDGAHFEYNRPLAGTSP